MLAGQPRHILVYPRVESHGWPAGSHNRPRMLMAAILIRAASPHPRKPSAVRDRQRLSTPKGLVTDDPVADAYEDAVRQTARRLVAYWKRPMIVNPEDGQCGACDQPVKARYGLFAFTAETRDEGVCLHHYCACYVRSCTDAVHGIGRNFWSSRLHPPDLDDDGIEVFLSQFF